MQFISNGPDIPNALLQEHEEGRLVFFCGAGISYPAGLPGFKGLVDKIYTRLGTRHQVHEKTSYDSRQFDTTIHLLEGRFAGKRPAVRKALLEELQPDLSLSGALDTHRALLELARDRKGCLRLVTTNFDRVFECTAENDNNPHSVHSAPFLPIPKEHHWNGLVYLHGLLPANGDESTLQRLVVSSGDFGNAYLTERWAARFVTELLRNYTVCFVGYSIDDAILRYMMDALAADRMLGATTQQAYALANYKPGEEKNTRSVWEAKGVMPILYESPNQDYSGLHRTLKAWAETYRDGITGKERIVIDNARLQPSASTVQDDFVERMRWALSDKSGKPAKIFADFNPAPSLKWLDGFLDRCYKHIDLPRFSVPPHNTVDEKLCYSLMCRPTPYTLAPFMSVASIGEPQWDNVMLHLARWLLRHLNNPFLLLWVLRQGGQMHSRWQDMLEYRLNELAEKEKQNLTAELDEIRINSPQAIPSPKMRSLWLLLLNGRLARPQRWERFSLLDWKEQLKYEGLSASLRMKLRELLAPMVVLSEPIHWDEGTSEPNQPDQTQDFLYSEMVLACEYPRSFLSDLAGSPALPQLLEEFQQLLRDALDLRRELGKTDGRNDRSYWELPSISTHFQNRGLGDWVTLIELLRDSWLAVLASDPSKASKIAYDWFKLPYSTFKRLAFFAASHTNVVEPKDWGTWLLSDNTYWLWSPETTREVMRLLVLQGRQLILPAQEQLEDGILAGPPRGMFRDDLGPEDWQSLVDRGVWLRLVKLASSGLTLGEAATNRLEELKSSFPAWQLDPHEKEEFHIWKSGTGYPDYQPRVDIAPRKRAELVEWLMKTPPDDLFYESTWSEVCRKHLLNSSHALSDLAKENQYPIARWQEALYVWRKKESVKHSWKYALTLMQSLPDDILQKIAHAYSQWLNAVSEFLETDQNTLLELCERILALPFDHDDLSGEDNPINTAINNPIGIIAETLINIWFKRQPQDDEGLPDDIEPIYRKLCDIDNVHFRHARVILAFHLITLFRVDRDWTEQHMLPLFDWSNNPVDARAMWAGFLQRARLFPPLLQALKAPLLSTVQHYETLGSHKSSYVGLLTFSAVDRIEGFTTNEFQEAFESLPQEALEKSAQALAQAPQGDGEQRASYWKNRILPFWQAVWPKSGRYISGNISVSLALMAIAVDSAFPEALETIRDWLQPVEFPGHIFSELDQSGLCSQFPNEALQLLDALTVEEPTLLIGQKLKPLLKSIAQAAPELKNSSMWPEKFKRL